MKVSELLNAGRPTLSFEVFPPKTQDKLESVKSSSRKIAALQPDFMSVTYGAAGGTREFTVDMVDKLQKEFHIPVLSHFTCVSSTKEQVRGMLDSMKKRNIENVLALRGDVPEGGGKTEYLHAADLIREIRALNPDLCIGAACYPEGHPESADKNEDIRYLKEKVDAGVDFLTSQMFFQTELYYRFLYRIREAGIGVPVCAGIMPVTSAAQVKRVVTMSNAYVPQSFSAMVDRFGGSKEAMKEAGIHYAVNQIMDLLANGVTHIHVYTMNQPSVALRIKEELSEIWKYEVSRSLT